MQIPNRTNIRAAPSKGYANDGRGRQIEFGDYFLKVTANEDRPDVIETYLSHVASEVALRIVTHGTMPVYSGTALKDRLKKIRKTWDTKTKNFCRRYGIEPAPSRADEDDQRFARAKQPIYRYMRAGQLTMEQASRFAVEANIEMCRWRAKYNQAVGNHTAPSSLADLSEIDGLQLPTSDEFDKSYKPQYNTIVEFVGHMFAECQERIRQNHDRLHGVFPKIEIRDPTDDESSEEEDQQEDEEVAAAVAAAAEKAGAAADVERDAAAAAAEDAEHENMFPEDEA